MDRITFFESIKGLQYPNMLVHFFDQILALNKLAKEYDNISVENVTDNISFLIHFKNKKCMNSMVSTMYTPVNIYGRYISVYYEQLSDSDIRIILK
jgi:hypothetical protein